ncbi:hypothetical protein V8G54_014621, partial [Vigna mungo]
KRRHRRKVFLSLSLSLSQPSHEPLRYRQVSAKVSIFTTILTSQLLISEFYFLGFLFAFNGFFFSQFVMFCDPITDLCSIFKWVVYFSIKQLNLDHVFYIQVYVFGEI